MFEKMVKMLKENRILPEVYICSFCHTGKIVFYFNKEYIEILIELTSIPKILFYTFLVNGNIKFKGFYDYFNESINKYFNIKE